MGADVLRRLAVRDQRNQRLAMLPDPQALKDAHQQLAIRLRQVRARQPLGQQAPRRLQAHRRQPLLELGPAHRWVLKQLVEDVAGLGRAQAGVLHRRTRHPALIATIGKPENGQKRLAPGL